MPDATVAIRRYGTIVASASRSRLAFRRASIAVLSVAIFWPSTFFRVLNQRENIRVSAFSISARISSGCMSVKFDNSIAS
jgi:hypothetical protein